MNADKDESSPDYPDSEQLVQRLADVEILYLLSFQPLKLNNLVQSLRTTFDFTSGKNTVRQILANLEAEGLVAAFRKENGELGDSSEDLFGISPVGLRLLKIYVDSLSATALTMQLGFNQKLMRG